jgi:hypothetical protein
LIITTDKIPTINKYHYELYGYMHEDESPIVYDLSRKISTVNQKMGSTSSITAFNNRDRYGTEIQKEKIKQIKSDAYIPDLS